MACLAIPCASYSFDYNGNPVGWAVGTNELSSTVQSRISTNWRPTSIDAVTPGSSTSRFATCYVQNSGTHAQTVMLAVGRTATQLNSIRTQGWRIEDVERVGNNLYTAILIRDTLTPLSTNFFANLTQSQLTSLLGSTRRLIDLDSVVIDGVRKFNGVWKTNTGGSAKPWGWMPNHTLTEIGNWANQNNMRVIDLDPRGGGRFAAVFVRKVGNERVGYAVGSWDSITYTMESAGLRMQKVKKLEGSSYYAAILTNNVDAQGQRVANQLDAAAGGGRYGAYLRQVGGPVIVNLASTRDMYPASAIKVLIHVAGLSKVPVSQLNTYKIGNRYLSAIASNMMMNSNNPDTYTLNQHWGTDFINGYGRTSLGTSTRTYIKDHYGIAPPDGQLNANSTLVDMTNIYANRGVLGADRLAKFRAWMSNDTNSSFINTVASQVKAQLGLTTTQYNAWRNNVRFEMKAGNIGLNGSSTLNQYWINVGRIQLPFKGTTVTLLRQYVFGHFVHNSITGYQGGWTHSSNLFREQMVQSMQTYK